MTSFPHLFSPITLGGVTVRNRIFSPAHGTTLGRDGCVGEDLIAYHQVRARGGAGLIILEGMTLHPSYGFPEAFLYAGDDAIVPGLARLAKACKAEDCKLFGQLFHAGRAVRLSHDGSRPVTYSASDVPDERYRVVPVPMEKDLIREVIAAYGDAAARLARAGLDGVEVLAGMGYLIAQFLNPRTNRRDDEYGGTLEGRLRLLREIIAEIRRKIGPNLALGLRISADEMSVGGLEAGEVQEFCAVIDGDGEVDYFNVIAGSSATPEGWIHVFPPMAIGHGYAAPAAAAIKARVSRPVASTSRRPPSKSWLRARPTCAASRGRSSATRSFR